MKQALIFKEWRARCSSLGHILTNLPEKFSKDDAKRLKELIYEKETGILPSGNKNRGWTDTKQTEIDKLLIKKNRKDSLPDGCITHLEDIFRSQFWGRKRLLHNKYLEKGTMSEEDALELLSVIDGEPHWKNDQQFDNEFIQGCPDNIEEVIGRDTKCNYDMDTYDKAELTKLYEYQLKGYGWLTGIIDWELCYCLVNTPYHQLKTAEKSLYFAMGQPADDEPRWVEAMCQLERNMIFDMGAFLKENPGADLMHGRVFEFSDGSTRSIEWRHDVPPKMRVKRFHVKLEKEDIAHFKRRVKMCRQWLIAKEKETLKLLES